MKKEFTKNWKTTVMGLTLAVLMAWQGIDLEDPFSPKSIFTIIVSGGIGALGYLMKDDILKK
jgi:hypothetical protein